MPRKQVAGRVGCVQDDGDKGESSRSTFARGARHLVIQKAFDMIEIRLCGFTGVITVLLRVVLQRSNGFYSSSSI